MPNIRAIVTIGIVLTALLSATNSFAQSNGSKLPQSFAVDPAAGKDKSRLCQGCHGEDGNGMTTLTPKLAGQNAEYISKQIHNFQSGTRLHRIMNDLATTVNDNDLPDIAAYFASLNKMRGDGLADNSNGIGKELFITGDKSRMITACTNCHGTNGKGLEPNSSAIPVIGGQHKDYLLRQLSNFRKGDRSNSPDGIMNLITKTLSDTEIESLAEYISKQ